MIFSPARWLFSGWNCTAMTLSFQIMPQNSTPYSHRPQMTDGSCGTT